LGRVRPGALPSAAVASNPALDTTLMSLGGETRPLEEWLTTFHLASVVLDPYTNESSWVLKTAARILENLRGTDARVNFVVTADADSARQFLGPLTDMATAILNDPAIVDRPVVVVSAPSDTLTGSVNCSLFVLALSSIGPDRVTL